MSIADRLGELEVTLPPAGSPLGNYVTAVQSGNLLFLSGHTSTKPGREVLGKLGADITIEQGYAAARSVALDMLATIQASTGSLDRVSRVIKLLGMVNSTPDFVNHPKVVNGASDFFVEVFGERGRHARAAIGVAALPGNAAVEIEAILELADAR